MNPLAPVQHDEETQQRLNEYGERLYLRLTDDGTAPADVPWFAVFTGISEEHARLLREAS